MATKQAIPGKRLNAFAVDPKDLSLVVDENHPLYDERVAFPVDEALVRNVMVYGVLEPVLVTKEGDEVLVVDGRQRVKAAIEANRRLSERGESELRVPCMVRRGNVESLFGVSVSANEQRLDDTPLGRARKAQRLDSLGYTLGEIAIVFGVTEQAIKGWLVLSECSPKVQKAVETGMISATAAVQLATLSAQDQVSKLEELIEKAPTSGANGKRPRVSASAARKATGGKVAPGKRQLKKVLKSSRVPKGARALLQWVVGELSTDEVQGELSWLSEVFDETSQ